MQSETLGNRLPRAVAVVLGIAFVALGAWAMVDPRSFFATFAAFEPYNQHFLQDVGAFQIGLGAVLLLAGVPVRADGLATALGGVGIGSALHTVSHIIGRDLGGSPEADILTFGAMTVLLLASGGLRWRRASRAAGRNARPMTGPTGTTATTTNVGTEATSAATQAPAGWMPRHAGRERAAGCVWLPRLIDKGRRVLEGEAVGRDLLGDYHFGVNDSADAQLLRFLGMTNEDVLAVLRQYAGDDAAADKLVRRSGRTPAECAAWSARFVRRLGPFLAMMDADEGRRPPGAGTTALRFIYNHVIMPPTYVVYRFAERRRQRQDGHPTRGK